MHLLTHKYTCVNYLTMEAKQLNLGVEPHYIENEKIGRTRFTISLPLDISIKIDIERDKSLHSRNDWILMAIKEKLNETEIPDFKKLEKEILEIKQILERTNTRAATQVSSDK